MKLENYNLLNIKLKTFNIAIILFELFVILFMIYEITVLDEIQKSLAKAYSDKFSMIQTADKLRQSSDDLTHFARSYAVTKNREFEKRYLNTLKIRNGKGGRPVGYNGIYWDLDENTRKMKHPKGARESLHSIIQSLPFSKAELEKLQTSEDNSNELVEIEVQAFVAINTDNYDLAVELLHSQDYYNAKHKIMLPLDEMITMLENRTSQKLILLNASITKQFQYVFIVSLLFILGNILIYILLHKKINRPIKYLTGEIKKFQNEDTTVLKKIFYKDEVGYMIEQFFSMEDSLNNQKSILNHLNEHLQDIVTEKTADIEKQNKELSNLMEQFDKYIIASKTDLDGKITYVSEAFCNISGFTHKELIGQSHYIIRHPDMQKEVFQNMWNTITSGRTWKGEVKNRKKNGGFYWVSAVISPEYNLNKELIGYSAIRNDITAQKEVEELSQNLEQKVIEKTKDLQREKKFIQVLLDSQEQLIITHSGNEMLSANETFLDFFAIDSVENFKEEYKSACICETFNTNAPDGYLQKMMKNEEWIDYVISRSFGITHKVMITRGSSDFIFSVSGTKLPGKDERKSVVFTNITEMENAKSAVERAKLEIEEIHARTQASIEYAALIQSALIPDNVVARRYFKDYFAIWHPKDMVGGDIYFFEELRNEDECLLMVVDCTGHGVPGAFVTMLVKAIERSIVSKIKNSDEVVSPAKLLSVFNSSMKHLLKQEDESSISNAGFDGQIMYYNRKENMLKVASARNEIFYFQNDVLNVIKGDRQSIGYKDSDVNYQFTEHTIDTRQGTTIYFFTDGYWDQPGGKKGLPFGKKRLKTLLTEVHKESMADQQEEFLYTMKDYREEEERVDDITIVGIKI